MRRLRRIVNEHGFTSVEVILACVIFPIIVIGVAHSFDAVKSNYKVAKQLNEMYAVLSACPELDRALEFSSLSSTSSCYPNNVVQAEGGSGNTITYTPSLTVTDTLSLGLTDPLRSVPDSKVVNIQVGYPGSSAPPLQLRMLITRSGVGQL